MGHVTASTWIVDEGRGVVLLVLHRKLGLWLQPGEHCDADVANVARKEVGEETRLFNFHLISNKIFDLDIHRIPKWRNIPAHYHYDVRFLLHADSRQALALSKESYNLKWFGLNQVMDVSSDDSVLRMVEKTFAASRR